MLFGGGCKNKKKKNQSSFLYLAFPLNPHGSGKARSWQPWAMKKGRVKLAPVQTTGNGAVHNFLRIDALLQV